MSRFVGAFVLGLATFGPVAAAAQSAIPAEFPPAEYDENQYVDSEGCAFIRAGISGVTNWVPRMSQAREPLCGFQPTFAQAPEPEPTPTPTPTRAPAPVVAEADPAPAPQSAPQPAPAARPTEIAQAPAPAPRPAMPRNPLFGGPIETVASVVTPPNLGAQSNAPARVDAPRGDAVAADVRTITLAEACDGRTGIQPRLINSRTGAPIDCGPAAAPVVTPVAAPVPAPVASAEARVLRLTLAEICARSAAEGTRFVNAETGAPIACPAAPTVVAGAAPAAPSGPAVPPAPSIAPVAAAPVVVAGSGATSCVSARLAASSRGDVRCGPQTQSPSGYNPVSAAARSVARSPAGAAVWGDIPASNPSVAVSAPTAPVDGYRSVWDDGRVNPQRGLSAASVAPAPPAAVPEARVSSRSAPQATTHRYVQVGTYGDPANADRAAARLRALGLPVGFAQITRNGQPLRVVAAGPFASAAQLQSALSAARAAGYGDAFTRR